MTKTDKLILVFDLDDTLYKEIDFLKSAFLEIATYLSTQLNHSITVIYEELLYLYHKGLNVFETVIKKYALTHISTNDMVFMYRSHIPKIELSTDVQQVLIRLKQQVFKVGLITDGRSLQQRQKIKALGLADYFDDVIISEEFGSEKPNPKNFIYFEEKYGTSYHYIYVGDNIRKDFIAPNSLGWTTVGLLDNGQNIHPQSLEVPLDYVPKHTVEKLLLVEPLLSQIKTN